MLVNQVATAFLTRYKTPLPHSLHRVLHSPWLALLFCPLPVRWEPCFSHQQMLCHPSFILYIGVLALASMQSRVPLSSHRFQRGHPLIVLVVTLVLSCLLLILLTLSFESFYCFWTLKATSSLFILSREHWAAPHPQQAVEVILGDSPPSSFTLASISRVCFDAILLPKA